MLTGGRARPEAAADGDGAAGKPLLHGQYAVGRLLGKGNFAKVYHATCARTGAECAIKIMEKEHIRRVGLAAHIKNEVAVLHRIRHPNVVRLDNVMATKSKIFFVMEFVPGGELFHRVKSGRPLREDAARKYFQQLIAAVAFCHARGVFHRDIKPENLLVDANGDLKISDFGFSTVAESTTSRDGLFHTFCGTPAYVAPEVLACKGYDAARADIWSCGVVLFVLMAGYAPFRDANLAAMYRKIFKGAFRCPPWFPPELVWLVRGILNRNASRRFTIADIMKSSWFQKGFKEVKFYVEDNRPYSLRDLDDDAAAAPSSLPTSSSSFCLSELDTTAAESKKPSTGGLHAFMSSPSLIDSEMQASSAAAAGLRRAPSMNAFDIISFSSGCNLAGLFEEEPGEATRFLSRAPVHEIIARLEEIAAAASLAVVRAADCGVSLQATRDGQKGALSVDAEIAELAEGLVVVDIRKKTGDNREYKSFRDGDLMQGLRSVMVVNFVGDGGCGCRDSAAASSSIFECCCQNSPAAVVTP